MIENLHKPIMVNEILKFTEGLSNLNILDCTFGGGGHTLQFLNKNHKVFALDCDPNAIDIAKNLKKKLTNLFYFQINFKDIDLVNDKNFNQCKFDFILLDLGYSSNQLENVDIGISFKTDANLNMNYLDSENSAFNIINNYSEEDLSKVFFEFGEIFQSKKLAKYIVESRKTKKINTNFELIEVLRDSKVNFKSKKIHFATQAFQALRIEANNELANLKIFLNKIHDYIQKGGFLAIISFHSLEDRIVKNFFKDNSFLKGGSFKNGDNWAFEILTKKPITPQIEEIKYNPRSRSAKLRVGRFIN